MSARQPPQALDSERNVIGAVLLHPPCWTEVRTQLADRDFSDPRHGALWRALEALESQGAPIDRVALENALEAKQERYALDSLGGAEYLDRLTVEVVSVENVSWHAKRVATTGRRRRLAQAALLLGTNGLDAGVTDETWQKSAAELVDALADADGRAADPRTMKQVLRSFIDELGARYKARQTHGARIVGVPSGFSHFDELTGGMRDGSMYVLAARPAMGKSALAMQVAANAASQQVRVLAFSLEMSAESLAERLVAAHGNIEASVLANGTLTSADWLRVNNAASDLADVPLVLDDRRGLDIRDVQAVARRWRAKHPPGTKALVVVDYLQLLEETGNDHSREREVAAMSRGLKRLSGDCRCPVLALAQLNRELERRNDKRPQLSDLRDSGAIEQDADVVTFLYRDEVYNADSNSPFRGTAEWIVAKHRGGPLAKLWLDWNAAHTRFTARDFAPQEMP